MVILVLVVGSTLIISAACSLFEAVLYSSRIVTLEAAADRRTHRHMARLFLDMKKDIASPTASILILNHSRNVCRPDPRCAHGPAVYDRIDAGNSVLLGIAAENSWSNALGQDLALCRLASGRNAKGTRAAGLPVRL